MVDISLNMVILAAAGCPTPTPLWLLSSRAQTGLHSLRVLQPTTRMAFRHPTSAWGDAPAPRYYDESFAGHTGASTRYFFAGEACGDDVLRACLVHSEAHGAEAFYRAKKAEQDKKDKLRRKKTDPPRYDWIAVAGARRDPPHPPTAMVRDARPNSFGLDEPSDFVYVDHWPWRVPARQARGEASAGARSGSGAAGSGRRAAPRPLPPAREDVDAWQPQFQSGAGWSSDDACFANLHRDARIRDDGRDDAAAWRERGPRLRSVEQAEDLLAAMDDMRRY